MLSPFFRSSVRTDILSMSGVEFSCEHSQAFGIQNLQTVHNASIDILASFDKPIPINYRCFSNTRHKLFVHFVKQREWAFLRFESQSSKFRCLTCNASHHCQHWAAETTGEDNLPEAVDSKVQSDAERQQHEEKFRHDLQGITENGFLKSSSHSTVPFPSYSGAQKLKMVTRITSLASQFPNGASQTFLILHAQIRIVFQWRCCLVMTGFKSIWEATLARKSILTFEPSADFECSCTSDLSIREVISFSNHAILACPDFFAHVTCVYRKCNKCNKSQ